MARLSRLRLRPRLGLGSHLALGLAAVGIVVLAGQILARRTTRTAVEAVRSMQAHYEPLAVRSGIVIDQLTAYDRTVGEYLDSDHPMGPDALSAAETALNSAVQSYFEAARTPPSAQAPLLARIASHVALGQHLAEQSGRRRDWQAERRALLDADSRRIVSAGGAGLVVNGNQVVARRSLAELDDTINALRAEPATGVGTVRAEARFRSVLRAHQAELMRSPGPAWLELIRQDLQSAIALRRRIERFDARNREASHSFLTDGAALLAAAQASLQEPARADLSAAAERAAQAAIAAERTLAETGVTVLAVVLLVSIVLGLRILLPVRRLTAATRRLTEGSRDVRAPRAGLAELDALAESFNAMADQVAAVEQALRTHQGELEERILERTRQLHHLAHHDPLTRLPNRRKLATQLEGAIAAAADLHESFALVVVDLDNFKSINDTLGHTFGDRVLQAIGERLEQAAGAGTLVARLGGDEFTVILEAVQGSGDVSKRVAALLEALQQPLSVDGRVLSTSASAGASLYPDHAGDVDALLRAADVALFRAKELGRNRFALYSAELADAAEHHFGLEQALRRAVEAGELLLMYQPLVALHTFEPAGVEALLRWRKPDGRIASAREFVHIAEQTGLMRDLSTWVLRSTTSAVAAWRAMGWHRASVAINVSAPQFFESDFVDHVAEALRVTGLPPSALELELTETVLQTGATTIRALERLRELGVEVSLDDFGTGYSSLTSLQQLPITRVKLDRSLVETIDSSPRSVSIVRSVIALCHGLGLRVVAEGVERAEQLELLAECGPVCVQGFLLAHPVEAGAVPEEVVAATRRAHELLAAKNMDGSARGSPADALVLVAPRRIAPM
jgi:diguanylate cyclase (GGDEF)-like protein